MQSTLQNESNEIIDRNLIRKIKKKEELNQDLQLVWNLDKLSFSDQPHMKKSLEESEEKKLKGWNNEYNSEEESKEQNNYQSQISFRFQSNRERAKKVADSCGGFEESEDYGQIEQEEILPDQRDDPINPSP